MGRVSTVVDPYPLTDTDRLALAHLRRDPGLTARLREAHVAGADGHCRACAAARHVKVYAPCEPRLLADTAHAAIVGRPVTSALGPDLDTGPVTDRSAVGHLIAVPAMRKNALIAHAVDVADAAGLCTGCHALGIVASAPCSVLTMAEIARTRADSVLPVICDDDYDDDYDDDDLPDDDPDPMPDVVTGLVTGPVQPTS